MDRAIIDNKTVSAYEISLDYEREKLVRTCSRNKKILCVDSNCKNPVLRYCHGDKKGAYFAHLTNTECDYDKFDKNDNVVLKELRIKLLHNFTILGYKVETECKLLKHHYSPVVCSKGNESFVIEIGDSRTTMSYVEKLLREYSLQQIPVKWLVVGEEALFLKENRVSFLKRFLLNETKNNDFILVNGDEIIQYRFDKKVYKLNGYSEIYQEKSTLKDLCVIEGELSINGYNSRFLMWQNKKEREIEKELIRRQEEKRKTEKIVNEQTKRIINEQIYQLNNIEKHNHEYNPTSAYVTRTYTCTKCGKKASASEFYMMQEDKGLCFECQYGPERYAEIKKHKGC